MKWYEKYKTARLISAEEWKDIMATIPNVPIETKVGGWWWLCAEPDKNAVTVGYVARGDMMRKDYLSVLNGIRPLFCIPSKMMPKRGEKVLIGRVTCTVVGVNNGGFEALADDIVATRNFYGLGSYINSPVFRNFITL